MSHIDKQSQYSIRQLLLSDWELLKSMRLEALRNEQRVFGGSYEVEAQRSDAEWQALLAAPDKAYFGLFMLDGDCVGITGVYQHQQIPEAAFFLATYLRKEHRGQKLSELFYNSRIDWAREYGFEKVMIAFRDDNFPSIAAGERAGFVQVSSESKIYPDGTEGIRLIYELELK